jgi:hypothetical protein
MKVPTGFILVLAGMLFITLYPCDPYWLYLAGYQLGLGALMFGMLAIGVAWADWGFAVFQFVEGEFYRGTSLAVPFLLLRADGRTLFPNIVPDATQSETKDTDK